MKFNFKDTFDQDHEKWGEFDTFLSELADRNTDEFKKTIYINKTFLAIGYKLSPPDIMYAFHPEVPTEVQDQIVSKIHNLFP